MRVMSMDMDMDADTNVDIIPAVSELVSAYEQ